MDRRKTLQMIRSLSLTGLFRHLNGVRRGGEFNLIIFFISEAGALPLFGWMSEE